MQEEKDEMDIPINATVQCNDGLVEQVIVVTEKVTMRPTRPRLGHRLKKLFKRDKRKRQRR